jgi:anti-sigma factor RsiW
MTCDDELPLAHALADGELNVIHAPDIEAHVARCSDGAAQLAEAQAVRTRLAAET